LGDSDLSVSVIGLGTWAMGGDYWGASDDDASVAAIRRSLDMGVNLIDTAPGYGRGLSEELVGRAIKGYARDKVVIATKCGIVWGEGRRWCDQSGWSIKEEVELSLKRLSTDHIDLYQMHWPDPHTPIAESVAALMDLKREGKIRYMGVSNFSAEQMGEARKYGEVTSLQPQYSLLCRKEQANVDYCGANGIGTLSYGSLGSGILSGKFRERPTLGEGDKRGEFYKFFDEPIFGKCMELVEVLRGIAEGRGKPVGHVAINWVNQRPGITCALVGARTAAQAEENALSGEWELSPDEIGTIDGAYGRIFE